MELTDALNFPSKDDFGAIEILKSSREPIGSWLP